MTHGSGCRAVSCRILENAIRVVQVLAVIMPHLHALSERSARTPEAPVEHVDLMAHLVAQPASAILFRSLPVEERSHVLKPKLRQDLRWHRFLRIRVSEQRWPRQGAVRLGNIDPAEEELAILFGERVAEIRVAAPVVTVITVSPCSNANAPNGEVTAVSKVTTFPTAIEPAGDGQATVQP